MAVGTITLKKATVVGNLRLTVNDVVGTASYTTNGDALTAKNLGLNNVLFAKVQSASGWRGAYDQANSKLLVFGDGANTGTTSTSSPLPQAASTTDLHTVTFRVLAIGT